MRAIARGRRWVEWTASLAGVMGLLVVVSMPVAGQDNPSQRLTQLVDLDKVEQLNQQAEQLFNEGKYDAAIPLAERSLAILEKALAVLAEVEQLNQQAEQLSNEGKYNAAIPLAERVLDIYKEALGLEHLKVGESLNNLASLYESQGNYPKAELLFQEALAIWEKTLGPEHPDVAVVLNNLAGLYKRQGDYPKAEPLHQRALAILEKALGPEHLKVAISLNNLADLYHSQGNYSKAEPVYQRSLAIREKALGPTHPDLFIVLNNLADLYTDQGNYSKAELIYQRSLAIREKALGPEHLKVAISLNNLASLYERQGYYPKAEPLLQKALAIFEKSLGSEHPDVAISLGNLASLYERQGYYPKAEPLFQRALAIFEKSLGSEHPNVATSLSNLAGLYTDLGNYPKAEPLLQRALAIREKSLGSEHPDVATSLGNLASLYESQGNYSKVEPIYQRSLAILKKALGPEHPDVATSLGHLAGLYTDQGNYPKAEPLLQRALAIREKSLGPEHPDVAISLNNLASLYESQGSYSKVEPIYQRSLAILEKALGPEHPDVAISLDNLAGLYWVQGNVTRTLEFKNRSSNIQERNLALVLPTGSESQKRAYIATLSNETDLTVSLHVQGDPDNLQAASLALTTILRRKGRVLDALIDSQQALLKHLGPEDQALLDQLVKTRSQLAALIFKKSSDIPSVQYRNQLTNLENKEQELEAALSRRSAEFRTQSQPVTIEAVQQLIPADAALVELMLYKPFNPKAIKSDKKWGVPRYVAYVLHSQGSPKWTDLGDAETINSAVADFRQTVQNRTAPQTQVKRVARTLDAKLMQPIRQLLGETRTVLLSPDSQLNLIPFAALVDEQNQYLLENYSISYLTSGRDLLRLQVPSPSQQKPVIVANPDFDNNSESPSSSQLANNSRSTNNRRSNDLAQLQFEPLEGTATEAKAIALQIPGVQLLTGSQATENALKQLHGPSILHIATHGFFLKDEPSALADSADTVKLGVLSEVSAKATQIRTENPLLRSGLVLAGFNQRQSGSEDGVLTALEAAGLDLRGTKLVVLSACETGLGDIANGEGVYGLRRAFAISGAESQLISLWQVNDDGTKDLMVNYYQRLQKNVGRSEALRQTQLYMLQSQQYRHPHFWAPFIASGDWKGMGSIFSPAR